MKNILSLAFVCILIIPMAGQNYQLIPYRIKEKWGFADSTQQIVIKPKYEDVTPFLHGYAAFKEDGKWGILNIHNKVVTPPKLDIDSIGSSFYMLFHMEEPMLDVRVDHQWQSCDTNGNITNGDELELASVDDYYEPEPFIYLENGLYGIKDHRLNVLVEPDYQKIIRPSRYNNTYYFKKEDKWGAWSHSNRQFKIIIENKYDSLSFGSGVSIALLEGKMGIINYRGEVVLPLVYDTIVEESFTGFYVIDQSGKTGFATKDGQLVIPPFYTRMKKHHADLAYSYLENGKWGYSDKGNGIEIEPKYARIKEFKHGYAEVTTLKGKKGYINVQGVEFFKK